MTLADPGNVVPLPGTMKRNSFEANRTAERAEPLEAAALESIVASLEEDVVLGRLHPRERLVEDELMARFGAKRHVVRDALARLDQMGLVERRKNIGALVRSFELSEVEELYHLRGLLESEAARLIRFPVPEDALKVLEGVQRMHDAAAARSDMRQVFRVNQLFHRTLFSLASNDTLAQAIEEYARRTHSIRFITVSSPEYVERARQEHWKIVEALRGGDRKGLVALCRAHLEPARLAFREAMRLRQ